MWENWDKAYRFCQILPDNFLFNLDTDVENVRESVFFCPLNKNNFHNKNLYLDVNIKCNKLFKDNKHHFLQGDAIKKQNRRNKELKYVSNVRNELWQSNMPLFELPI